MGKDSQLYEMEDTGAEKIFRKFPFKDKKQYKTIPDDLRMQLIDAVENRGEKIKHVISVIFINNLSA